MILLFRDNHRKFKKFILFIINNKIIIKMNFLFFFLFVLLFFFYLNLSLTKKNMNIYNNIYLHYMTMFIITI